MANEAHAELGGASSAVFDQMRSEHREVLSRMDVFVSDTDRIGSTDGVDATVEKTVRETLDHLAHQFDTHMKAEDDVIYTILEDAIPTARQSIAPLRQEHDDLRSMLAGLNATLALPAGRARNEQVAVQGQDFADLLRIHIRKEESVVFSVAERMLQPAEIARIVARLSRSKGASNNEA